MRKKSILSFLLAASLLVTSLTGCSNNNNSNASTDSLYKAGTYTGVGEGFKGEIKLEVTFSDKEITNIDVLEHGETAGVSDAAFTKIPEQVISNQSLAVDTVTGCTFSSKGIISAIENAASQAGADVEALKNKEIVQATPGEKIEKTADVIVIGGGGAGISAAAAAAENGAKVILIEKNAALGGNTLASGGAWNAADPELQITLDTLPGQIDTLKGILEYDENEFGDYTSTLKTLKEQINTYLAGDTSKMFDSVELHIIQTYVGGKRQDVNGNLVEGDYDLVSTLCENSLSTFKWLGEEIGVPLIDELTTPVGALWTRGHNAKTKMDLFTEPSQYIESKGGEIMLETKAEELILTDGRVTGVKAVMTDGTEVSLTASKGVVIATGGFGANAEMVKEYNTYWPAIPDGIKTTCVAGATGDGIKLGQDANASLVDLGLTQLMPTANSITGSLTDAILVPPQNYLFVNKEGVRFVNEYAERDVLAFAALEQTDGMFYAIADQVMSENTNVHTTQEQFDQMVEKGILFKADTLEELAEMIGVDADTLIDTVNKFNSYVDSGVDPDFGKNVFERKIETAPYYAVPSSPSVHHTMGGLEINVDAEVLSVNGDVIPGLFAAGEVTGGIHAGNRLGGNAIADIFVFGRIAGTNVAK
ncbi:flavocytochrome c [Clostridium saudiense]|nr:flavocytochrome c [Clostridium saudiense]